MSLDHSFSKILCRKTVISILHSSHFSALCPLGFTIFPPTRAPSPPRMLYVLFLPTSFFYLCCWAVARSHFPHLSASLFCIYRTPVTVKALMWGFIYVLPTLFAFPYCFTDVGSSGKEAAELDHLTPVFTDKHHSNLLCIGLHSSEANGRNKSSGHHVTVLYVLCLYRSVQKCIYPCFSIFFLQGHSL